MKIEKTIQTKEVIDVQLPVYRKNICFVYKVYSEKKCIQVEYGTSTPGITTAHAGLAWSSGKSEDCEEHEFMKIYERVQYSLEEAAYCRSEPQPTVGEILDSIKVITDDYKKAI